MTFSLLIYVLYLRIFVVGQTVCSSTNYIIDIGDKLEMRIGTISKLADSIVHYGDKSGVIVAIGTTKIAEF